MLKSKLLPSLPLHPPLQSRVSDSFCLIFRVQNVQMEQWVDGESPSYSRYGTSSHIDPGFSCIPQINYDLRIELVPSFERRQ